MRIGPLVWVLVGVGVVVLGLAMAYATLQWSKWRKHRTLEEKRRSDEETRAGYRDETSD